MFNFGFLSKGSGAGTSTCIENAQTDTTWNGHMAGTDSTMKPAQTESGLICYEFKWDALDINGNVEFSLGSSGDEQEPGITNITLTKDGKVVTLSWNATAKAYIGSNLEFTTYLNTLFVVGEDMCLTVDFLPAGL